jgi:hypothetical protein
MLAGKTRIIVGRDARVQDVLVRFFRARIPGCSTGS